MTYAMVLAALRATDRPYKATRPVWPPTRSAILVADFLQITDEKDELVELSYDDMGAMDWLLTAPTEEMLLICR